MEPISLQSLINLTQDDGSVLSPQGQWTLSDFKSYWPFLRKYQTSPQTFADLSRLVYCMEHGLKFEWSKAWVAHRTQDWPEPPLDAQMLCLEHKRQKNKQDKQKKKTTPRPREEKEGGGGVWRKILKKPQKKKKFGVFWK